MSTGGAEPVRRVVVDRTTSARGEVVLLRRDEPDGSIWELRVNGVFVMDTHEVGTEQALATAALDRVERPARVLVGGLGLGFTVKAILADPRVETVQVVEIEEAVLAWMRDGTVPHGPALIEDPRVRVQVADIVDVVGTAAGNGSRFDLILLDVDNGPGYLVHDDNDRVYATGFLRATREALAPGGAVALWSAAPAPDLAGSLAEVFGSSQELRHEVDLQGRAEQYVVYLASR